MIFEFSVAALLFFGIMFFVITYLNQNVRSFSSDAYREVLQSKAFLISEMILRYPGDWEDPYDPVVGFEKDWPVMDTVNMTRFQNYCNWGGDGVDSGYNNLRKAFGISEKMYDFDTGTNRQFNVTITNIEKLEGDPDRVIVNCGAQPAGMQRALISRVAVNEAGELLSIKVNVW